MLPELGKYAVEVLSAYAVSLGLLGVVVVLSLRRGRAAQASLEAAERETREAKVDG